MKHELGGSELRNFLQLAWRRRWVILVPFLAISMTLTIYGLYLPNLYRSTASIFIEPPKVPEEYVKSTVTTDIAARLRTIRQQLTSRTKILQIIDELDLYPEAQAKDLPTEVLVATMREDLEVEVPNQRDSSFFMVHYTHRDPTKAMLAVSRLIEHFIEENLLVREEQAEGTTLFIEEQAAQLKIVLEEQEYSIQQFKQEFMGQLPDQLDANLRMLDNLNIQMKSNLEAQREVENRVLLLEQEVTRLEGQIQIPAASGDDEAEPVNTSLNDLLERRVALRQEVVRLESTYTSKHPDVIAARRELDNVEKKIQNVQKSLGSRPGSTVSIAPGAAAPELTRELTNLRRQLNENRPRLAALRQEERTLRDRIREYQARVEEAPKREQELLTLTRDYENTKKNYEDLLNKKMEAQLSENLEKRRKGEKFRIMDPANLPEKPYRPNRLMIIALGLVVGLGFGIGLATLLESVFPAFYSLKQLEPRVDYPIVMAIPLIASRAERQVRKKHMLVSIGVGVAVLVVFLLLFDIFVKDIGEIAAAIRDNVRGAVS
ncbi:MAG: hypothetical protein JSV26_11405 [bacterium]|nr:MAG: hypothetical protein JSV26_11405 [bacterium]